MLFHAAWLERVLQIWVLLVERRGFLPGGNKSGTENAARFLTVSGLSAGEDAELLEAGKQSLRPRAAACQSLPPSALARRRCTYWCRLIGFHVLVV